MTAQLPPNLLKLFASRPALPYSRPVGKSPNTIRTKRIDGVASLLAQIRDDAAFTIAEAGQGPAKKGKTEPSTANGDDAMANGDVKEEGEEDDEKPVQPVTTLESPTKDPNFTYAEETRRQVAREDKAKRRKEMFENAKTSCESRSVCCAVVRLHTLMYPSCTDSDTPNENKKARGDPYKTLFIARLVRMVASNKEFDYMLTYCPHSPKKPLKPTFEKNSRCTALLNTLPSSETRKVAIEGTVSLCTSEKRI